MIDSLSNREIEILRILYQADGYVKAEKIANQIGKSLKTIRNDINNIKLMAVEYHFNIVSKANCGYKLCIDNYNEFNQIIANYNDEINDFSIRKERIRFYEITFYLLLQEKEVSLHELEEEFYFSYNVLKNELGSVKMTLSHFSLELRMNKDNLRILGSEYHKRLMLSFLMESKRYYKKLFSQVFDASNMEIEIQGLVQKLEELLLMQDGISLSSEVNRVLAYYLFLSNYRNQKDIVEQCIITDFEKITESYPLEYALASNMMEQVSSYILSKQDLAIFTILIISFAYPRHDLRRTLSRDLYAMAEDIISMVCKETGSDDFQYDAYIHKQIYAYLYAKPIRDRFYTYDFILAPLKFRRKRMVEVELAYTIYDAICTKYHTPFVEREVIFLMQCLSNLLAKINISEFHVKVAIASKYGCVEANRIADMLSVNYIQFKGNFIPMEIYELRKTEGYDLVITDSEHVTSHKPVYRMKEFPQFHELLNLVRFLRQNSVHYDDFRHLLEGHIKSNLKLKTRKEVFAYIQKIFHEISASKENIINQLIRHDDGFPYEVGKRAAFICVRKEEIQENAMYLLVLEKPILWHVNYVNLVIVYYTNMEFKNLRYLEGSLQSFVQNQELINEFIANPCIDVIEKYLHK